MRLIDADRVSEIIYGNVPAPYEDSREAKEECLSIIEESLTIDAVPVVHGHWICTNIAYGEYKCSVCEGMDTDCSDYYSNHNVLDQEYCPWCGAKMDKHAEEEI